MSVKNVVEKVKGKGASDGAGVKLTRVLSHENTKDFDPFLMLDAFDSKNPDDYTLGFPMHPHRGIETVTYLISGEIKHKDSLGNVDKIGKGQCQWMTSGSGILHEEMPLPSEHMLGIQLWVNLPQENKMCEPKYFPIDESDIKVVENENSTVKIISGHYNDAVGVTTDYVKVDLLDITVKENQSFSLEVDPEKNLFIYTLSGQGYFGDESKDLVESKTALRFGDGSEFQVKAGEEGIRFLLFAGKPLREPIAWYGPIVMNTREELQTASMEINNGTFIKHKK